MDSLDLIPASVLQRASGVVLWSTDAVGSSAYALDIASLACQEKEEMGVVWPTTDIGGTVTRDCPAGQMGEMSRACLEGGVWGDIVNYCGNRRNSQ